MCQDGMMVFSGYTRWKINNYVDTWVIEPWAAGCGCCSLLCLTSGKMFLSLGGESPFKRRLFFRFVVDATRCGNRSCPFYCVLLLTAVAVLQIFEGVVNLLDRLKAWHSTPGSPGNTELKEMAQIGLRIITGYIQQQHSPVSCTRNFERTIKVNHFSPYMCSTIKHLCDWTWQKINLKGSPVFI